MTDHKALIALVRDSIAEDGRSFVYVPAPDAVAALADALESASVERAVVEAQALEQAADAGERLISNKQGGFSHWLRARAVEIREGRQ